MQYTFDPVIRSVAHVPGTFGVENMKYEPMIFSGDLDWSRKNGGKLTNHVLDHVMPQVHNFYGTEIPKHLNFVVDTRVNMLMKGYYPSIPGWHCDDVRRGTTGQPEPSLNTPDVQHFMVLLSTSTAVQEGVSGTEFVSNKRTYNLDPQNVWHSLDQSVNKDEDKKTRFIKAGEVVRFDQAAIHRASPANSNGWRFFFRLSVTHRKPANEIRQQVQVYIDLNNVGW